MSRSAGYDNLLDHSCQISQVNAQVLWITTGSDCSQLSNDAKRDIAVEDKKPAYGPDIWSRQSTEAYIHSLTTV